MTRQEYVWRVVIDLHPPAPKDWEEWIQDNKHYIRTHCRYHYSDPSDAIAQEILDDLWRGWKGARRKRYLSSASAYDHLARLQEHGVVAHVEQAIINWTTPTPVPLSEETLTVAVASLKNSLRVGQGLCRLPGPTTEGE